MAEEEALVLATMYTKKQKQKPRCESSHSAWQDMVFILCLENPSPLSFNGPNYR